MKFIGQRPRHCQCRCCTGNNDSKAIHKSRKHGGRQKAKKDLKKELKESD